MNEKTTIYLDPDLKRDIKKELFNIELEEDEKISISALANDLFRKWLQERRKKSLK